MYLYIDMLHGFSGFLLGDLKPEHLSPGTPTYLPRRVSTKKAVRFA